MATHIHVHLQPKKTKDASLEEAAHSAASRSQSVDPKKGWAHTQTFTVGNKKVNVDFDGRFFRSGMMRASTLEGLLALHQKAVKDASPESWEVVEGSKVISSHTNRQDAEWAAQACRKKNPEKIVRIRKKMDDASPEDLKRELQRLENRMDAFTKSAPLKEKTETAERIKEIRKLLGTKDASSVASVEKDIATQERLIAAMEKNGKGEQAGPLRSRLKFLQEELEKAKVATETKDSKFTGAESAWKTKVLNTHPGTFFRPHPVQSNLVRATKDGKSVGFYDTEKREGEIEEVAVKDKWPDYLDRAVSEFKQAFTRPENYTSPLAISGTIRTYNFIMAETEKIVKAARSTPEEKQKAAGLAKEFQSKYSAKLTEMDKAAAASFKARK